MVGTVASPRRSLREAVFHSVLAYHSSQQQQQEEEQQRSRFSFYSGGGIGEENEPGVWEEEEGTTELVQLGAKRTRNVLILMSDTGGGHRASGEAIRDAFRLEFGDDYRVRLFFLSDLRILDPPFIVLQIGQPEQPEELGWAKTRVGLPRDPRVPRANRVGVCANRVGHGQTLQRFNPPKSHPYSAQLELVARGLFRLGDNMNIFSSALRSPPPPVGLPPTQKTLANAALSPPATTRRALVSAAALISSAPLLFSSAAASSPPAADFLEIPASGGVKALELREGGGETPSDGDQVAIHYYGRLAAKQGWRFDSTYDHKDEMGSPVPFVFVIGSGKVISGIEAAVKSMKAGGIRRVIIPPSEGYQNASQEPIPPNIFDRQRLFTTIFNPTRLANGEGSTLGTLIFDIELVSVRRP